MSKGSNITRSGSSATARVVSMSRSSNNAQSNLNILQRAQNSTEARTIRDEVSRSEEYGDNIMSQITGYRMMGRQVPSTLQQEYDRTQKRLKMLSDRYKQLTGKNLGY